jgi:hypothetical protein
MPKAWPEAFDDHRLSKRSHVVPIEQWDAALREPCGATWLTVTKARSCSASGDAAREARLRPGFLVC